jgi:O-antigen ligase
MRGGLSRVAPTSAPTAAAAPRPPQRVTQPDLLLYFVAAALLAYIWRFQEIFPAVAVARPTTVLLLAALGLAAITVDRRQVVRRLRSRVIVLLGLLLVLVLVGVPFSLDRGATSTFLLTWLLPSALLAVLIVVSVRTMDDVEWVAAITLAGGCAYVIIMHLTRHEDAQGRWTSLAFYDANDLALLLVGLLPLTLYFMWRAESGRWRLLAALCFSLFVLTIVRTGSRGGFLGLSAVLGYSLLAFRPLPARARVFGALAAVALLAAGGSRYWERMRTMFQPSADYNWSGQEYIGRGELWRRGLGYFRDRPLAGVGANGFVTAERELSPVARRRIMAGRPIQALVAHSTIVQVGAELGVPGLIVFGALIVQLALALRGTVRMSGDDPRVAAMSQALTGSLVGYAVCGLFLSAAYSTFMHFLIAFVAATKGLADEVPEAASIRGRGGIGGALPPPVQKPPPAAKRSATVAPPVAPAVGKSHAPRGPAGRR